MWQCKSRAGLSWVRSPQMNVEVSSEVDRARWSSPSAGFPDFVELTHRRGLAGRQIAETRGPATSMRRDAISRRMLVLADAVAVITAFVLALRLEPNSLQLTWASFA